jgi:predicted secreted protein
MAASVAFSGHGTLVVWNDYPVAELTSVTGPNSDLQEIDVTNFDSPDDYREFIMGAIESGEFTIDGNFIPTDTNGQIAMIADHQARTSRTGRIIFPEGKAMMTFTGRIKTLTLSTSYDSKVSFSATFKVSGSTTFTTVSAADGLTTPFFALRDQIGNAITPSPVAAGDTYWFAATLDAADTAIAVQPTAAAGTIKVNGAAVTSGAWSGDISVTSGTTKLVVIETLETDKVSRVYRIHVTRPSS